MSKSIAWALKSGNTILPFSIRSTRRECIRFAVIDYLGETWVKIKKRGISVIKVYVYEEPQ